MGFRDLLKRSVKKALGRDGKPGAGSSSGPSRAALPPGAVAWDRDITPTRHAQVVAEGVGVAIFRVDGQLLAIDNACTHEDGPLAEGECKDGVVTCPYHDWRFDVKTGQCLSHANRQVGCWDLEVRDGAVFVTGQRTRASSERGGAHDDGMEVLTRNLDEEGS
jgi:nitrite reductase (NADH) small subunit